MMKMNSPTHRVAASTAAGFVMFYVGVSAISPHHSLHASQPLYSNDDAHAPEREPAQSRTSPPVTISTSVAFSAPGSSIAFTPHWALWLGPGG
jgi:hypothetical protein